MTMHSKKMVRPPNSLLFISDMGGGEAPVPIRGVRLLSTSSCVSVGCYPEQDGPTEVVLGDAPEVDPGYAPAFDAALETPDRTVVVSTVERESLLEAPVADSRTRIRVWLNHARWPDKVIVGIG